MNETLKNILLRLTTEPLNVVQDALNTFQKENAQTLLPWENTLVSKVIKQSNDISTVFKHLFLAIPEEERKIISNQLIKPLFLAQAKLPAASRDPSFYEFIHASTQQRQWGRSVYTSEEKKENNNESWLANVLIEVDSATLITILNQTSQEEFNFLFDYLKENQSSEQFAAWLKKLPISVWNLFLSKLGLQQLEKINLLEIIKDSLSARQSFADYLIKEGPNKKVLWEWVQKKQLLAIPTLLDSLAIARNEKNSPNFDTFFTKFTQHKKTPNELQIQVFQPLLDPFANPTIQTFNLREQMIAYGLLAVHIGILELNLENQKKSGLAKQDRDAAKKTLGDYINKSPFLATLFAAQVFPDELVKNYLPSHVWLAEGEIKGHLQLAGGLPSGRQAKELRETQRQPQPSSASSSRANVEHPVQPRANVGYQDNDYELAAAMAASLEDENNVPLDHFSDEDDPELAIGIEASLLENAFGYKSKDKKEKEKGDRHHDPVITETKKESLHKKNRNRKTLTQETSQPFPEQAILNLMTQNLPNVTTQEKQKILANARKLHQNSPDSDAETLLISVGQNLTESDNDPDNVTLHDNSDDADLKRAVELSLQRSTGNSSGVSDKVDKPSDQPNPKIVAAIFGLFFLGLILTLCFTVGAPLWLIPIVTVAGILVGGGVTVAFNKYHQPPPPRGYLPLASNDDYDDEKNFTSTPTHTSEKLRDDALGFSQDKLLQKNKKRSEKNNLNTSNDDLIGYKSEGEEYSM